MPILNPVLDDGFGIQQASKTAASIAHKSRTPPQAFGGGTEIASFQNGRVTRKGQQV
jgi:hypothetical protein